MTSAKQILQDIVPPFAWRLAKHLNRRLRRTVNHIEYAPAGSAAAVAISNEDYWAAFVSQEQAACQELMARVRAGESILTWQPDEYEKYLTYGYVLAMASRERPALTVLDYGGNLADYYWIGRSLVPGVDLEYHCKELPALVEVGRRINPGVVWYADDSCLTRTYDLVMFSSSLQCLSEWRETLRRAAIASRRYLLVSDVPMVRTVATFAAIVRSGGRLHVQQQFNRAELLTIAETAGVRLVREFAMGPHPPIANAPEQPTCAGWLFERRG